MDKLREKKYKAIAAQIDIELKEELRKIAMEQWSPGSNCQVPHS